MKKLLFLFFLAFVFFNSSVVFAMEERGSSDEASEVQDWSDKDLVKLLRDAQEKIKSCTSCTKERNCIVSYLVVAVDAIGQNSTVKNDILELLFDFLGKEMPTKDTETGSFVSNEDIEDEESSSSFSGCNSDYSSGSEDDYSSDSKSDSSSGSCSEYSSGSEDDYSSSSESDDSSPSGLKPLLVEDVNKLSPGLQEQVRLGTNTTKERYYIVLHLLSILQYAVQNDDSKEGIGKLITSLKAQGCAKCAQGWTGSIRTDVKLTLEAVIKNEPCDEDGDISYLVGDTHNAIRSEFYETFGSKQYLVDAIIAYLQDKFVDKKSGLVTDLFLSFVKELELPDPASMEHKNIPSVSKLYRANVLGFYNRWRKKNTTIWEKDQYDKYVSYCVNHECLIDQGSLSNDATLWVSLLLRTFGQYRIIALTRQKKIINDDEWQRVLHFLYNTIYSVLERRDD